MALAAFSLLSLLILPPAAASEPETAPADPPHERHPPEPPLLWSLQPLRRPPLPALTDADKAWVRTPVDAFLVARMRSNGLAPSPEADRRVLIRRLYYDLIGLPPEPAAVEAFQNDPDPHAYEHLVDSLLSSPHYGERWARHWLDVAHYADTHGYDKDKPRPQAWPYRDYVIRAFNEDKPYSEFVREQLAGDVFDPLNPAAIEATGFIATGPWDFIGHEEVPESKRDGQVARHLDRDDMVATTMNTFVSLTVQCAQCHDHKSDPVSQEDYYSLQAVFAALDRTDREYDRDPDVALRRAELKQREHALQQGRAKLDDTIALLGGSRLQALDEEISDLRLATKKEDRPEHGYHSHVAQQPHQEKWVQVDLEKIIAIERIGLAGCSDDFNNIGAGFGFPVRFRIETAATADFVNPTLLFDATDRDYPNPGTAPVWLEAGGAAGRYVRITATQLAPRQDDYIFALAELLVTDASGRNAAVGAAVSALDSIEASPRWGRRNLVDGHYPGAATAEQLAELEREREELLANAVDGETRRRIDEVKQELAALQTQLQALPTPAKVYAGAVHHGTGNFRGTGPDGGRPRTIHVLRRGNVADPIKEVQPRALPLFKNLPARFDLPPDHFEGLRRAALAEWITHPSNPLTWRSIVNRIWLYHFGKAIAGTPNDFGHMGEKPVHPDLLDWLAVEFRDGGQSIKQLHRLMVTSAVYRQSSAAGTSLQIDSDNRYLSRMTRRRLSAEEVRDSVLALAGKLKTDMYGPGFEDFAVEKPEHSPHYQYHLHDPNDADSHRRTIYRFIVRSQPQPFLTSLDCADPSMLVPERDETVTALQALALLNNRFMVTMAKQFGRRIEGLDQELSRQIEWAFHAATGRPPSEQELNALLEYTREHGTANLARVLFNLNEFLFVD